MKTAEKGFLGRGGGRRVVTGVLGLVVATGLATGCETSFGVTKAVEKAKVEREAANLIATQAKLPAPVVTCPGDLEAKAGATLECTMVTAADPTERGLLIEVVGVAEDGTTNFDISLIDGTPGATPVTS